MNDDSNNCITKNRLITCQGSIQLLTAIAVINFRQEKEKQNQDKWENYIVIYDLFSPNDQELRFAEMIKIMAAKLLPVKKIIYFTKEEIQNWQTIFKEQGEKALTATINNLFPSIYFHEIYCTRNWQFTNSAFLNTYSNSDKICFGDGIGIHISDKYFARKPVSSLDILSTKISPGVILLIFKNLFQNLFSRTKKKLTNHKKSRELPTQIFDKGYFLLEEILGERSKISSVVKISKNFHIELFYRLSTIVPENIINEILNKTRERKIVILMTTNFSEASKMTLDGELQAYVNYIQSLKLNKTSVIIIKPHPRDSSIKLSRLKLLLQSQFDEVLLLNQMELFFIPFEILYLKLVEKIIINEPITIITFSTACFSFPIFFNVIPLIGFGEELVNTYFYPDQVEIRNKHESDLKLGIKKLKGKEYKY